MYLVSYISPFYNGDDDYSSFGVVSGQRLFADTNLELKLNLGAVSESGGALGSELNGLIGADRSNTVFANMIGEHWLTNNLALRSSYEWALTQFNASQSSFLGESGQLVSDSLALGLVHHGLFGDSDQLSLTLSQPLAVTSVSVSLTTATAVDAQGNYTFQTDEINLAATDRESRLTASFATQDWFDGKTEFGVALVHNADHVASAGLDVGGFLRFTKSW